MIKILTSALKSVVPKSKNSIYKTERKRVDRFSYARAPARYGLFCAMISTPYSKKVSGEFSFNFLKPILLDSQIQIIPDQNTRIPLLRYFLSKSVVLAKIYFPACWLSWVIGELLRSASWPPASRRCWRRRRQEQDVADRFGNVNSWTIRLKQNTHFSRLIFNEICYISYLGGTVGSFYRYWHKWDSNN